MAKAKTAAGTLTISFVKVNLTKNMVRYEETDADGVNIFDAKGKVREGVTKTVGMFYATHDALREAFGVEGDAYPEKITVEVRAS